MKRALALRNTRPKTNFGTVNMAKPSVEVRDKALLETAAAIGQQVEVQNR
jgi:hypothetical protein